METTESKYTIFPKGDKAPAEYFTGTAWVKPLVANDDELHTVAGNVIFEAGARNYWHNHPGGQILMVIHGIGYYQQKGQPIQKIQTGDVVKIAPGIEHWHGASHESEMTHIAINTNTQNGVVNWLAPVTDEEYNSINK